MKRLFPLYIFFFAPFIVFAQDLKVMSFNIRYDNPEDGINRWDQRKMSVLSLIQDKQPDILGVQEAMDHQVEFISENLKDYKFTGVGRDDGKDGGEFSGIFYSNSVNMIKGSTFWLSETPEQPSKGWDAALPRICTYALFEHSNGKRTYVFNTHFDHMGEEARAQSSRLILKKIKEINIEQYPVILMGDFNASIPDPTIQKIIREYNIPFDIEGPRITFTGFDLPEDDFQRIDFIFSDDLKIDHYAHLSNKKPDQEGLISDHLPIYCEFSFVTEPNDSLFQILKEKDSLMFEVGFNTCNTKITESLITDDLEFYHDIGGISKGKQIFMENMKNGLCRTGENQTYRKLVDGTLEVYPLYSNGELYGAIQSGIHSFYQMEAKFSHLWLLENGEWKIARVLSYDHRTE